MTQVKLMGPSTLLIWQTDRRTDVWPDRRTDRQTTNIDTPLPWVGDVLTDRQTDQWSQVKTFQCSMVHLCTAGTVQT